MMPKSLSKFDKVCIAIATVITVVGLAWIARPRPEPKGQSDWPYELTSHERALIARQVIEEAFASPTPTETPPRYNKFRNKWELRRVIYAHDFGGSEPDKESEPSTPTETP